MSSLQKASDGGVFQRDVGPSPVGLNLPGYIRPAQTGGEDQVS